MRLKDYVWPAIGFAAVAVSAWLLYKELRGISYDDLEAAFVAIPVRNWIFSGLCTVFAYAALAGYDHIALAHLGRRIPFLFISLCSFTTYALSHNIGGSVVSGGVIRYRAYSSRGLTMSEVGVLVAFCSFTFALSMVFLAGLVLLVQPWLLSRYFEDLPHGAATGLAFFLLGLVALYIFVSYMRPRPRRIFGKWLRFPRLRVVWRQLLVGPLELIAAAAIIYFALPETGNPGFVTVLGIFIISFGVALLSHAPGGLGVLEFVFVTGLPEIPAADVVAALLVFRLFYLLIPFLLSLAIIVVFERGQLIAKLRPGRPRASEP
ncbi:lysylphosphatidylglycerol synthase domain-containing protein [Limoniibacter endophyticus]|uniref:Membrane protein n=1 Tax=Limoniibacter endophyticus TaxID=1565040 RepID=A0A8J3DG43_9HYPH|nr:lysylphosphatidylglycerol synthase domain-containing protein [Limoniibacter endophyticus]GHC68013.1 membrane protein [Limoniibacter endophyticus]